LPAKIRATLFFDEHRKDVLNMAEALFLEFGTVEQEQIKERVTNWLEHVVDDKQLLKQWYHGPFLFLSFFLFFL
jgi:hypothetical protein